MNDWVVEWPTLGDLGDAWLERHCRVPDGFSRGAPFHQSDWQFWCTANYLRVRPEAEWVPDKPLLNQAFHNRRAQIVGPQKYGKGPWSAGITALEACGPCLFGGWAKRGDRYRCEQFGCPCGWEFAYESGEPMGIRHPSPLIQLLATSADQVDNVYGPLRSMIALGPLKHLLKTRENFIRIVNPLSSIDGDDTDPDADRIDKVTSSALSRLGNPISFALQDESGTYTKSNGMRKVAETQRRGAAGMGGRTIETTNAWDPTENSVAQTTYESPAADVFKFYLNPDEVLRDDDGHRLSYLDKRNRRKIHAYTYAGSPWVDLDSIEAEAAELLQHDPAQAARFFGNRLEQGAGVWLAPELWDAAYAGS